MFPSCLLCVCVSASSSLSLSLFGAHTCVLPHMKQAKERAKGSKDSSKRVPASQAQVGSDLGGGGQNRASAGGRGGGTEGSSGGEEGMDEEDGADDEDWGGRGRKGARTRGGASGASKGAGGGGGAGQWRVFRSAREFVRQLGLQVSLALYMTEFGELCGIVWSRGWH